MGEIYGLDGETRDDDGMISLQIGWLYSYCAGAVG